MTKPNTSLAQEKDPIPPVAGEPTPGPWKIGAAIHAATCPAFHVIAPGIGFPAHVFGDTVAEAKANARLIAAAPELLDALRRYVDLEEYSAPYSSSPMREAARTAIAKAEGK